tara:strand:- start:1021 stop:1488 length:468 start_codon:yes stop_codon:yes gene_type:complete
MYDNAKLKMNQLGIAGEKLVSNFFRSLGHTVEESLSTYDHVKDMIVDDETCEVKTQQLFHTENAFSMKKNQLTKCRNVDKLIFVEAPAHDSNTIKIWDVPKEDRKFRTKMTKDGHTMYLLDKGRMDLLDTIEDAVIVNEMKSFSNSSWKGWKGKN